MINPNQDGITHINIYSKGKTLLGRMLSNFYSFPFVSKKDGKFNSVEGYWHWLGIQNCEEKEVLRTLYGHDAKKIGSELRRKYGKDFDNDFENKILRAIWYKVKNNAELFNESIEALPFEHYYNFNGRIVDVKNKYIWMINGIEKMRHYIY